MAEKKDKQIGKLKGNIGQLEQGLEQITQEAKNVIEKNSKLQQELSQSSSKKEAKDDGKIKEL